MVIVPGGTEAACLAPRPLRALPGIGLATDQRVAAAGRAVIGDLAALDDTQIEALLPSSHGIELRDRARGIDPCPVDPSATQAVSIGHKRTFPHDVDDPHLLADHVERLASLVTERLLRDGRGAGTVTVKLCYPDFSIHSRAASAQLAIDDKVEITRLAQMALTRALAGRPPPVRRIGVSVTRLVSGAQLPLPPT